MMGVWHVLAAGQRGCYPGVWLLTQWVLRVSLTGDRHALLAGALLVGLP